MDQACIADASAVEVELGEVSQSTDVFEAIVGNESVSQIKLGELTHAGQARHPFIVEWRITDVEIAQVHEWREGGSVHFGLRQPQLLEIGQFRQERQALVLHVDIGQEMQAEVKLLEPGQIGDRLELIVGIQPAARIGIPLRPGQFQLAQAGQAAESFEFARLNQRADQIDAADTQTRRQILNASDRLEPALDREAATLADDPLGDHAF